MPEAGREVGLPRRGPVSAAGGRRGPSGRYLRPLELLVVLEPPAGDIDATGEPHPALGQGVLDEFAERRGPAGVTGQAWVQPDRHHLRVASFALPPVLVEATPTAVVEVRRAAVALGQRETYVVVRERAIGDHEVSLARHVREVREIVVVGVRVVQEAALLDQQLAGVHARSVAAVPAQWPLAAGLLDGFDRPSDVPAFLLPVEQPVLDPAPAMRAGLVPALPDPGRHLRVAFEGDGSREERGLQAVLVEEVEETEDAGSAPVLVDRLGGEVTMLLAERIADLGEALVALVTRRLRVLGTLLVVDHEADGHPGPARPAHLRLAPAVADEVAPGTGQVAIDQPGSGHPSDLLYSTWISSSRCSMKERSPWAAIALRSPSRSPRSTRSSSTSCRATFSSRLPYRRSRRRRFMAMHRRSWSASARYAWSRRRWQARPHIARWKAMFSSSSRSRSPR